MIGRVGGRLLTIRMLVLIGCAAFAGLPSSGCGGDSDEAPTSAPRGRTRGGRLDPVGSGSPARAPSAAAPELPAIPGARGALGDEDRPRIVELAGAGSPEAVGSTGETAPEATGPAERDLGAEVRSAFGSPTSCFDFARVSTLGDHLTVHVGVTVMPSGRVTHASVSAAGLQPAEIACLNDLAMRLALRGPIEGAPRTINASIEYTLEARPAEPAAPAAR